MRIKKIILTTIIILWAEHTFAQQIHLSLDTTTVKYFKIEYPDSSKCFFYFWDSKINDFCRECFFKNFQRSSLEYLCNGKRNGPFFAWFENGRIEFVENYVMNCLAGSSVYWYNNGQLKCMGNYYIEANDSLVILNPFYSREKIMDEKTYVETTVEISGCIGSKHGKWEYYSLDGKLEKTEQWDKGKLISTN